MYTIWNKMFVHKNGCAARKVSHSSDNTGYMDEDVIGELSKLTLQSHSYDSRHRVHRLHTVHA